MLATRAPAKLNLYLDVLGRRPDGYHALETLFVALEHGDDLTLEPTAEPGVALAVHGAVDLPEGEDNLAARAATAWFAAAGPDAPFRGARLTLEKRLPLGGGLGGGSSDAAATLRLLERAAPPARRLGPERLAAVARGLGADVPFFLVGGAALGRGRGDLIEPLPPPPPLAVVLVTPAWGHETARVFAHAGQRLRPSPQGGLARAAAALAAGRADALRAAHENALALAAMRAYPAFTRFASEVEARLGRAPCLTGTGSTLFDVCDEPDEARAQAARLSGLKAQVVVTAFAAPEAAC